MLERSILTNAYKTIWNCNRENQTCPGSCSMKRPKKKTLKVVEVMDIASQQWYTAADLPVPLVCASATICKEHIYMVGGGVRS